MSRRVFGSNRGMSRRSFIGTAATAMLGTGTLIATLESCGGGGGQTSQNQSPVQSAFSKLGSMSGSKRQQFLEKQAASEGKVVMYSADDPVLLQVWNNAFNKQYPNVQAQFIRMTVPQVLQKATTETQTRHPIADILHVDAESLAVLKKNKALAQYNSPEASGFGATYNDPDHFWAVEWLDQEIIGFNTKMVQKSEVPTTLDGLTDPRWKGKLAMPSVSGPDFIAGVEKAIGKQKANAVLKKLAAQDIKMYDSNTAMGNALAAGQVQIGMVFLLEIASKLKAEGAPVDWVVPNPLLLDPYYQVVLKDAPHPYAAALAYDWVESKVGQAYVKNDRIMGPRKDTAYPSFQLDALSAAKKAGYSVVSLSSDLMANPTPYENTFNSLFLNK